MIDWHQTIGEQDIRGPGGFEPHFVHFYTHIISSVWDIYNYWRLAADRRAEAFGAVTGSEVQHAVY